MKTVVFDLDGTLADTSADLTAAANACFERLNLSTRLDPIADAQTAFYGGRAMLRLGFSRLDGSWGKDDIDESYPHLLQYYGDNIDRHTFLYPGVEPALDRLAEQGFGLGICTNKPEGLAETLVGKLGIRDRFGALLGADTLPVRKPDPEHLWETIRQLGGRPDASVLIGDTNTDRMAAKNASVPCVLVTFGPSGEAVKDMEPEALLDAYEDLPDLMDQMISG